MLTSLRFLVPVALALPAAAEPAPDFAREVRPILSNFCFHCHGPDEDGRKGGLRLDVREAALAPAKSGARAIVPEHPDTSELVARILSDDPDEVMPPPATKKLLTPAHKETLRRWIAAGAPYQDHWAFIPPQRPQPPEPGHPIDAFIRQRLRAEGLAASPPADPATLLRRVSLDLVGLPPSPEEAAAFVREGGAAYEAAVDRLLASPHYGERWARKWLDLARYADTNGYEKDRPRQIWPWRDWVVRAFNADMPFDRFTVAQIAGDMLPDATADDVIATGFHRNSMLNEEGGIDPLEFRFHAMTDRMAATGASWLGLTLQCAQCHTHKFDPIQHREYYQLMAFLNNAEEPDFVIRPPDADKVLAQRAARRAELIAALPDQWPAGEFSWQALAVSAVAVPQDDRAERLPDHSVRFAPPGPAATEATLTLQPPPAGAFTHLRLDCLTDPALPGGGPGRTPHGNFVISEVTLTAGGEPVRLEAVAASAQQSGYPLAEAVDGSNGTGWAVHEDGKPLNSPQWAHFRLASPLDAAAGPITLAIRSVHGGRHTPGRVRVSLGRAAGGSPREAAEAAFARWRETTRRALVQWRPVGIVAASSNSPRLRPQPDGSILADGDITKSDTYEVTIETGTAPVAAVRLEALPDASLPGFGPGMTFYEGRKGDFFMGEFRAIADGRPLAFASATHSFAHNGFGGKADAALAIDGDPQTGWSTSGAEGRAHEAVFVLAAPIKPPGGRLSFQLMFGRHYACSLGRFRLSVTDAAGAAASGLADDVRKLLSRPDADLDTAAMTRLREAFLLSAPELEAARRPITALEAPPSWQSTLVMRERPADHTRATFIHHRGEYTQPKDRVEPGVPAFLPPLPAAARRDRLAFARWLVDRSHPLTARVVVNRQWAAFFGRGLVRTVEDFGYQGELPSHPELLDWLAVEFMESGWSLKKLHRLIVTSETYRQSSRVTGDGAARDPENILLWRGPRHRLEAEQIRDSALMAAGLLSLKMGGPGVYPPQPAGVTTEGTYGAMAWTPSAGEDRHRRSLYTFVKRTAPFAMSTTFDAPSGEACVARRDVSNTPLQSLTLLNDVMFMEAAQALAEKIVSSGASTEERLRTTFFRLFLRQPAAEEVAAMTEFLTRQEARAREGAIDAAKLTGGPADPARAAWVLLARSLLNTDEFVGKQ